MPAATETPPLSPVSDSRLLLVSNRLPITIKRNNDNGFDFSMSSGGLVTGLSGLSKTTTFQWYGWPGLEVPDDEAPKLSQRLKDEYNAVPVFIDAELADRHYNGFSSEQPATVLAASLCIDTSQTLYCGPCSITTLAKLPLTNRRGMRIAIRTGSSRRLLRLTCRTGT